MPKYETYRDESIEEWSALYVDGKLEVVGDSYLIDERLQQLVGVELKEGNFLLGGDHSSDVAKTSEEIDKYEVTRTERQQQADELREQAAKLLEEADRLS